MLSKHVHLKQQFIKKRASQGFLDPIQKHAFSKSMQLEALYLKALLYLIILSALKKGLGQQSDGNMSYSLYTF